MVALGLMLVSCSANDPKDVAPVPAVEDPPSTSQTAPSAPSASSTAVPEDLERIWLPALVEKGAGRSELDGYCDRFR